jgi:hypothetical protein
MENQFVQITSQNCHNCGASIQISANTDNLKCEYCETQIRILRPVKMNEESMVGKLNDEDMKKYRNMLTILENSMKAGNFKEGYDYCNKALEVDPTSSEIWENKAICSFWLSTKRDVFSSQAKEIVTYLNTAKSYDANSKTLPITSKNIAWDLYSLGYIWLHTTPKMQNGGFLWTDIDKMFEYVKLWDTAFDIYNETHFLKEAVIEFTVANGAVVNWLDKGVLQKYPLTQKLKETYIKKIQKIEPSYVPPKKKGFCFIATATMGSYDHPEVMELRNFRDNWILEKNWGEGFVTWYYHYGSIAAKSIEKSFVLKKICYLLIVKPLYILSKLINTKKIN